ncbi:class I SAM-dependent methyltransferase [Bdellovibrio sp. HCB337]|uniref:class I SAM-dependent methyltransferase n=1 Tax=Bdellovibrio sp. HCB337 TaxID=3394358 RepID=UPI0039A49CB2
MDSIAKTSLLTAAMRAVETNRTEEQGRLFVDPYAELLAGDEGKDLLQKAIAASGDQPAIAIRTAYMDTKINQAVQNGVRQIVMLAAGMDTRAYRLPFPEGTTIFELDRKEVLNYKQDKLSKAQLHCQLHRIPVDLATDWVPHLLQAGFKKEVPTLWLVEGLLMYLEESQVMSVFQKINSLASTKDYMLFDILTQTLLDAPYMVNQLQFLKSIGAPWKFGTNEPEMMMKSLGWDAVATQAGEFAPTRWPFPTAPRHIPNVPRGFYMEARKV